MVNEAGSHSTGSRQAGASRPGEMLQDEIRLHSPRNQSFHYHGNAETYMLVGEAMGEANAETEEIVALR